MFTQNTPALDWSINLRHVLHTRNATVERERERERERCIDSLAVGADLTISKAGPCRKEELPQNTKIAACDRTDPLQQWALHDDGSIEMTATGECLQLDSGQGGDCAGGEPNKTATCARDRPGARWTVWSNNAASALCDDPASCCGGKITNTP